MAPFVEDAYASEPRLDVNVKHGDWRDQLYEDGFVVVKGVITLEKAQEYTDRIGGMFHGYSVQHKKVMWDARTESGMIKAFSKLWGTDELLVSFDGMNLTIPADQPKTEKWPHVDQSPFRKGLQCVQGILNLMPNGPKDGGLIVMKGSSKLNELFFKTHEVGERTWGPADWFGFTEEEVNWFLERGCEIVKVCAEPGDLILWDSRVVHYSCLTETKNTRAVMYICYSQASFAMEEDLKKKADLFKNRTGTTHWPHANIYPNSPVVPRLGKPDTYSRDRPFIEPEETDTLLKLAGVRPYKP